MMTLHIEAETMPELITQALTALGLGNVQIQMAAQATAPAELAGAVQTAAPPTTVTFPTADKPKRERAKKVVTLPTGATADDAARAAATSTNTEPNAETLEARFRQLVAKDYDTAAAILDELGVETFPEVVAGDLLRELAAKLATAGAE